jgi:hypothetical protein
MDDGETVLGSKVSDTASFDPWTGAGTMKEWVLVPHTSPLACLGLAAVSAPLGERVQGEEIRGQNQGMPCREESES